jgi:RNA polymerase sigma-70 factor (ECF subfamily)
MKALHDVYLAHGPAVRRFAGHLAGNASQADDLTQEAFVRLWTTTSPIRTETVRAYLFAIVRNLHRRGGRHAGRLVAMPDDVVDTSPGPDERVARQEDEQQMRRALASLDDDDRVALLMRIDGELSYDDIGQAMGTSAGAARVRVHRSKRKLAALILEKGVPT